MQKRLSRIFFYGGRGGLGFCTIFCWLFLDIEKVDVLVLKIRDENNGGPGWGLHDLCWHVFDNRENVLEISDEKKMFSFWC